MLENIDFKNATTPDERYAETLRRLQNNYIMYLKDAARFDDEIVENEKTLDNISMLNSQESFSTMLMPMMLCADKQTSLLQVMGIYIACTSFSKMMDKHMSKSVKDAVMPEIEKKVNNSSNEKWKKRKEFVESMSDDDVSVTPESLSMMRIAFYEQACDDLANKNADVKAIERKYKEANDMLLRKAKSNHITESTYDKCALRMAVDLANIEKTHYDYFKDVVFSEDIDVKDVFTPKKPKNYEAFVAKTPSVSYERLCALQEKFKNIIVIDDDDDVHHDDFGMR